MGALRQARPGSVVIRGRDVQVGDTVSTATGDHLVTRFEARRTSRLHARVAVSGRWEFALLDAAEYPVFRPALPVEEA